MAGLKRALKFGNAEEKYPIGTEIPDTWNGNNNPLIVGQYLDSSNSSLYGGAEGAILIRKYLLDSVVTPFGNSNNYPDSTIRSFLINDYANNCSSELQLLSSTILLPWSATHIEDKYFVMSTTEMVGASTSAEGIAFELWKQRTALTTPNNNDNAGRVMRTADGVVGNYWLRTARRSSSNLLANYVYSAGNIATNGDTRTNNYILPACFIAKD